MSAHVLALTLALGAAVSTPEVAAAQRAQAMRFQNLDRDRDGRITRDEWNGSDRSFRVHDWNSDGVLSGDEVRPGARADDPRDDGWARTPTDRDLGEFRDWTAQRFDEIDANGDLRITQDEWRHDRASFTRADRNGNGVLTRREFLGEEARTDRDADDDAEAPVGRFVDLDTNRDGRVSRTEWRGSRAAFDLLDDNRDGLLTRAEIADSGAVAAPDRSPDQAATRTRAYRAGEDRGLADGRNAGREDRRNNAGWDLDGQRELEQADAGYDAGLGVRAEYQAGYRAGFRSGYREGFGPR
jgi:Ca2+-binding EF-hand superfamily protein